jgi:hypothetical protein
MKSRFEKTALILAWVSIALATGNYLGFNLHNIIMRIFYNE